MSIWHNKKITTFQLNERSKDTMGEFLGIKFTEIGNNFLKATMPANSRTFQPMGIIHGGANVALAETIASTAANCVVDINLFYCVGLEINANHLRSVRSGLVTGITTPIHIGRSTQVWHVEIFNEDGQKTCISRMTAAVLQRKPNKG